MMNLERYWMLLREADSLYRAEKYQEVIDSLENAAKQFPNFKPAIYYSGICAATKLEKYDLAFDLFKEILDEGGWYSEVILRQSPSLKPLQGMSEFEKLLTISVERFTQASKNNYDLTAFPDNASPPHPLMLALHAGGGCVDEEFEVWKKIVDRGFVLGMPRSTNLFWSGRDGAYWPDSEPASNQIKDYIAKLNANKSLDLERTIFGGLSMGAGLAISLALTGIIPARGFIVVAPGGQIINESESWQPLIEDAKDRDLHGVIILGEEDVAVPRENIRKLVKMLNDGGIPCKFLEYPGLGHWYPPDFMDIVTSFIDNLV
ncbi:MAG: hypothetical protein ACFFBD_09820 [Candidatus Hodarchaeota archaeon]